MSEDSEALAVRRRKLIYRSNYTGTKETDILLSRFAERYLEDFDAHQLDLYEAMLKAGDPSILAWVMGREDVPPEHDNEVTQLLLSANILKNPQ